MASQTAAVLSALAYISATLKTALLLTALLVAVSPPFGLSWNIPGHMLSAAIAHQILQQESPQMIDKVKAVLALHPWHSTRWQSSLAPFAGADADAMLFMLASRWADDIRTNDKPQHRSWDYIATARRVADRRMILTGYRLPDLLNRVTQK